MHNKWLSKIVIGLTCASLLSACSHNATPSPSLSKEDKVILEQMRDGLPRKREDLIAQGLSEEEISGLKKSGVLYIPNKSLVYLEDSKKKFKHHLESDSFLTIGDAADIATTTFGLSQGVVYEANPIVSWAGDGIPLWLFAVKSGAKKFSIMQGVSPAKANHTSNKFGFGAACNNIAAISGAAPQVSIPIGFTCGLVYAQLSRRSYEKATGEKLNP